MAVNKSRVLSKVRRGGIATSLSGALNDRADFLRSTFESQSKYLQEEGLKRRSKIKGLQTGFKEAADFLDNYGMDEKKISKLIQSDPDAFLKFAQKAMKYQESGETLTPDLLNDAHDFSESSSYKDVTPQSAIEMMLPIYNTSSDPVVREKKTFLASLGADLFQPAATVANRQIEGASILGTTGGDIMSSLGEPLYKSGSGGVTTDYSGFKVMDSREILGNRNQMEDSYLSALNTFILNGDPADQTFLAARQKYENIKGTEAKVAAMILDTKNFGPGIGFGYASESPKIVPKGIYGEEAAKAMRDHKVPSSETGNGLMTPIPTPIATPPEGAKAEKIEGTTGTIYRDDMGKIVFFDNGQGVTSSDPDVLADMEEELNKTETITGLPEKPSVILGDTEKTSGLLGSPVQDLTKESAADIAEWERKYKGKLNNDGSYILVKSKPTLKELKKSNPSAGDIYYNRVMDSWERAYGKTHDPVTGYPLLGDELDLSLIPGTKEYKEANKDG
tara:strand:- start:3655 stop:5169 length:1515 start_codon:yes stop_codon:yes gene_type:complete